MIDLREDDSGTTLRIKVKPRAKRTELVGARGSVLLVSVTAPPERGRANRAVVELLAGILGFPRSAVEIVAGKTHREKAVRLRGIPAERVRRGLANALSGGRQADDRA